MIRLLSSDIVCICRLVMTLISTAHNMFTAVLFHVQVLVLCEWNRLDCSTVNIVTSFWCREEAHLQPPTWHTAGSDHTVGVRQPYPVFRSSSGEPSASITYWWNLYGCHHTICWFVQVSNLSTILSKSFEVI